MAPFREELEWQLDQETASRLPSKQQNPEHGQGSAFLSAKQEYQQTRQRSQQASALAESQIQTHSHDDLPFARECVVSLPEMHIPPEMLAWDGEATMVNPTSIEELRPAVPGLECSNSPTLMRMLARRAQRHRTAWLPSMATKRGIVAGLRDAYLNASLTPFAKAPLVLMVVMLTLFLLAGLSQAGLNC